MPTASQRDTRLTYEDFCRIPDDGMRHEILSPGTRKRDLGIKRRLFDRGGVREYWVIDPRMNEVTVFQRAVDGSFPRVAQMGQGDDATLTTPLLPGFRLSLTKLFAP